MKFLLDEDVYRVTATWLRGKGHDVLTAREANLGGSADSKLLKESDNRDRILLTRDSDFGELVFLKEVPTSGVVLLRFGHHQLDTIHVVLGELLEEYSSQVLEESFCTVESAGFRRRRIQ